MKNYNITKNCFVCVNYMHSYMQSKRNPLLVKNADYCMYKGMDVPLPSDFFYKEHDCCVLSPSQIADFDEDFDNTTDPLEIKRIFTKKYGDG